MSRGLRAPLRSILFLYHCFLDLLRFVMQYVSEGVMIIPFLKIVSLMHEANDHLSSFLSQSYLRFHNT